MAAVLAAVALHVSAAWGSVAPYFAADEVSYVGAARVLSGVGEPWTLAGSGYGTGLSLLMAPAWWFSSTSGPVYLWGIIICVVCAVAAIHPLSLIGLRAGLSSPTAVVIASLVSLAPARTVLSNYVLAEHLLLLVTAWAVVLAFGIADRPSPARFAAFGAVAGAAYLVHGRGAATALAAGVWILFWIRRSLRGSLVGIGGLIASLAFGQWIYTFVSDQLYGNESRVTSTVSSLAHIDLLEFVGRVAGTAWYWTVAWPVVGIVGSVALLRWRGTRSPRLFLVLALASTLAMTAVTLSPPTGTSVRLDTWMYGRYTDHLMTIVALWGLAALVRFRARWWSVVLAVTAVVSILFVSITVPQMPVGGNWPAAHVAGAMHVLSRSVWGSSDGEPWPLLVTATAAIGVLLAVLAKHPRVLVSVLFVWWASLSLLDDKIGVDASESRGRTADIVAVRDDLPAAARIGFDREYGATINFYAYAMAPFVIDVIELPRDDRQYDAVFSYVQVTSPREDGALPLQSSLTGAITLWVYPGDVFDVLEADGLLRHLPDVRTE